jgi:hypothetical protein
MSLCQIKEKNSTITREVYALNAMPDGTCRTLKNQYFKTSPANFLRTGSMGASGVIEKWKNEQNTRKVESEK